ncbi:hypothetical protein VPHD528_0094 [Vibrio phage D528]
MSSILAGLMVMAVAPMLVVGLGLLIKRVYPNV